VPSGARPVHKTVKVSDDFYAPGKLTVPKGSTIKWTWPYGNTNTHDVKLAKGPRSAKKFWSDPAAQGFTFTRKLTVAGTYRIVCTLHQTMKMTIVVK